MSLHILWYKKDLRIKDHAPLFFAAQAEEVLPIYVFEPSMWKSKDMSFRHLNFVIESLVDLQIQLKKIQGDLFVFEKEMLPTLQFLFETYGPFTLHSHMEHGLEHTYQRDLEVRRWIDQHGCVWNEYRVFGVNRGREVQTRATDLQTWIDTPAYPIPKKIKLPKPWIDQNLFKGLFPKTFQVEGPPMKGVIGGESEAIQHANAFFKHRYTRYQVHINKPFYSYSSSSLLSAYLTWGNLSIRMLHQATRKHLHTLKNKSLETKDTTFALGQLKAFESRLYWHCHFVQRVEVNPQLHTIPLDDRFEAVRIKQSSWLKAFEEGTTGIPLIDACIIALKQRGWINFKQRAMLASFATNTLLLDWREVGYVLARYFIDYEPGIHWSQMQMQSGLVSHRHIPIYDVMKQGLMHDEEGAFIKAFIPALKKVDIPFIFQPWTLKDNPYIDPIVDLPSQFEYGKKVLYSLKQPILKPKENRDDSISLFDSFEE
jgi:deoxyribodipyrimidine photo-lyase